MRGRRRSHHPRFRIAFGKRHLEIDPAGHVRKFLLQGFNAFRASSHHPDQVGLGQAGNRQRMQTPEASQADHRNLHPSPA